MMGEQLHGYVDAKRFDVLVRKLRADQPANEEAQA